MTSTPERRPGDIILDRYVPHLGPEEREEARAQLYRFVEWQMRILARLVREHDADSRVQQGRDRLDSPANAP